RQRRRHAGFHRRAVPLVFFRPAAPGERVQYFRLDPGRAVERSVARFRFSRPEPSHLHRLHQLHRRARLRLQHDSLRPRRSPGQRRRRRDDHAGHSARLLRDARGLGLAQRAALARGAQIRGELLGYGSTCDAYHRVRLNPNGVEPARAMQLAIEDAGVAKDEIGYIALHGTSTVLNDRTETLATKLCFGRRAYELPMSSVKSMIGHPQGASGAAALVAALLGMNEDFLPPTINYETPDPECDLNYIPNQSIARRTDVALCNCIGFGSKNSALVVARGAAA